MRTGFVKGGLQTGLYAMPNFPTSGEGRREGRREFRTPISWPEIFLVWLTTHPVENMGTLLWGQHDKLESNCYRLDRITKVQAIPIMVIHLHGN